MIAKRVLLLWVALLVFVVASVVDGAPTQPVKQPNGDYAWGVGVVYSTGQVVEYERIRFKVVATHVSQADWFPGSTATLWSLVGNATRNVGPDDIITPTNLDGLEARAPARPKTTVWGSRVYAPYVDVMLWPTLDVSVVASTTGVKFYTLAFVTADGYKNPAWGGITPIAQRFYQDAISKLRALGGDVLISFGGANGMELAQAVSDIPTLQSKYQSVIDTYQVASLDFDIEGSALIDTVSNDRRNRVISLLQKENPGVEVSYTLPVMPTGLTADGLALLKNACDRQTTVNVVNLMAMDYGPGLAPNGATGMGGYAQSAAQATYAQIQKIGTCFKNTKIGLTPMIGNNDVQGEVFRIADAQQVLTWSLSTNWMARLSMWSINRDTSKPGALYASSQIAQTNYQFAGIFKPYLTLSGSTPTVPSAVPIPTILPPTFSPLVGNKWPPQTFAPYVDVLLWPTLDVSVLAKTTGAYYYTLGFVTADASGNPSWGGLLSISSGFYLDIVSKLRLAGGDVIISFGGASGSELALMATTATSLYQKYQSVIDAYNITWVDFDIEGAAAINVASVDKRNQAIALLQSRNKNLKIGYTLPVMPTGLVESGVNLLKSAVKNNVRVDVINIMAMDYGNTAAPNGLTEMGAYAIAAAKATYSQAQQAGLVNTKIGITPMIGQNDVQGEIFSQNDARTLLAWAISTPWMNELSFWSANRDTSVKGALYASSQIAQTDGEFASIFRSYTKVGATTMTARPPSKPIALPAPSKPSRINARQVGR